MTSRGRSAASVPGPSHSAAYAPPAATSSSWGPSSVIRPSSTTATRSASCAVCSRCAMATTVRPSSTAAERALEVAGRARVEQRGRLVEHQGVRVGEHQPGQRELLRLGRGEGPTAGADVGVEALGQRRDPVQRVDGGQAPRAARRPSASGAGQQRGCPRSEPTKTWCSWVTRATCRRRSSQREVDERHAADGDRAGPRRVDPGEQPAQRRLAGAGRPDDGEPLARTQRRGRCRAARRAPRGRRTARRRRRRARPRSASALDPVVGHLGRRPRIRARDVGADLDLVEPERSSRSTGSTSCWA